MYLLRVQIPRRQSKTWRSDNLLAVYTNFRQIKVTCSTKKRHTHVAKIQDLLTYEADLASGQLLKYYPFAAY